MRIAPAFWRRSDASAASLTTVIHRPDQNDWVRAALMFALALVLLGSAKLITKVIRLFTFLLSTTFRRPAMYPSSSPAKIGTSALARIVIISIGLFFRPLGFGHSVGRRVTSGQHHKSGSKQRQAKDTEASPAEMLPGKRSDGCSGCSAREVT
jgi:hypothetical protein